MFRSQIKLYLSLSLILLLFQVLPGQDNPRLAAEKLQTEAEELYNKKTPEAREQAFPKFAEALKLWENIGDDEGKIKSLNRLNDISFYRSDFKECIKYSSQILHLSQKIGNKNLEGGVLGNLGFYHHLLGESRKGLEYLEKSAQTLGELGEKQRQSITLINIGTIYFSLGDIKTSINVFHNALDLKKETKDRKGEGIILSNLGFINNEGGNKRKALEYYEKALEISLETNDQQTQGATLNNIGSSYQDLGELQKASDYYQKSLALRRQIGDKYGQAMSMQNISSLYQTLGDSENALNFLNQSLEIFQNNGLRREEAMALSSIGVIFSSRGDKEKAIEFYQKALALQKTLDNKKGYPQIFRNIGKNYLEKNELQKSQENFLEALKIAVEINDVTYIADIHRLLGQNFEKLGNNKEAEENFIKAVSLQRESDLETELADTLYFYAKFEEKNARRDSALEKIREALKIIENVRTSILSPKLRSSFLAEQQQYYDFYLQLLISEHKLKPAGGFDKLALTVSESARARGLLDSLGELRRDIRGQIPSELLEEEQILRQTINSKESQRIDAVKQKKTDKVSEYEKELKENLRQYSNLQTKIRQSNPQFVSLLNPEPLNFTEIQKQILDENTVLLEYFLGEQNTYLFFVSKNSLEIFELPSPTLLESQIRQTLENLKARSQSVEGETFVQRTDRIRKADINAERNLTDTANNLLAPVANKIQNKRLIIVASGVLQYLPFGALKIPNQKSTQVGAKYLIETNEIISLPSVSMIPLLRQPQNKKTIDHKLAILADPVFSGDDVRLKQVSAKSPGSVSVMRNAQVMAPVLRSDFSRLQFSRIEAEAISDLANSNQRFVALDFAANLNAARSENLQKSGIVHFATHGTVNSQFPELSGIVLSLVDEKGNHQEGFLRLHDVYNLRLNANLVVLSACETALGKEIKGEGVVGLTRGFMFAGVPTVVASLWRVEDKATADLMKRFYQRMILEEMPPSAALRQAQVSMLKEKGSSQPFYWAGFTLQGDWK